MIAKPVTTLGQLLRLAAARARKNYIQGFVRKGFIHHIKPKDVDNILKIYAVPTRAWAFLLFNMVKQNG